MSPILNKFETNNNEVIITGDFNIDLLKIYDSPLISKYFDMLTGNSFYPKIIIPTRLSNNHGTLIDNFLCKLTNTTLDTTSVVLLKRFSDHQPYFILLNNVQTRDSPSVFIKITKQDKESIPKIQNELLISSELTNLNSSLNENPNAAYNILHKVIQEAKNRHMPSKFVKYNKYKHKQIQMDHIWYYQVY